MAGPGGGSSDVQWCFSQVKGAMDDDVAEVLIRGYCGGLKGRHREVEFNHPGELRDTEDRRGPVVIFQQKPEVCVCEMGRDENAEVKYAKPLCIHFLQTYKKALKWVLFSYTVVFGTLLLAGWVTYFKMKK